MYCNQYSLGASQSHGDCGKWKIIYIYICIYNIYNDSEGPLQNKPQTLADYEFEWIWSKLIGIVGVGYHPPKKKMARHIPGPLLSILLHAFSLSWSFSWSQVTRNFPVGGQPDDQTFWKGFCERECHPGLWELYNYLKKLSASQGTAWKCNMCKSWTGKLLLDPNKNLTDSSESFASTSKRSSETWTIPMGTWSQHQHLAGYSTCVQNS